MALDDSDLAALESLFAKGLAPLQQSLQDVSARVGAVESRLTALGRVTEAGFRSVVGRLDAVEERIAQLEQRVGRLVGDVTRGRTTDSERIAQLEARVAELEAKLEGRH